MYSVPKTLPKFLWSFVKDYKISFLGCSLVGVFWAINLSLTSYVMKLIIDTVSNAQNSDSLLSFVSYPIALYIGVSCIMGFIFRFHDWIVIKTYPAMKAKITQAMFNYVERHSYTYFQKNFSGCIGNKINDMAKSALAIITHIIENFFARTIALGIGAVTMFFVHPYFAVLLLVWSSIFISIAIFLSKRSQLYSEDFSETRSFGVGKVVDSLTNIFNVKLFAREKFENCYLNGYLEETASKNRISLWYLLKVKVFYSISITVLQSSMIGLLIYERLQEKITVGDFALILTLNMILVEEIFFIVNQLVPFSEEVGVCKQALSIISCTHEIVDDPQASSLKILNGQIVFDKVSFQYKEGQEIFSNKSLIINKGERVGLVGFSGSGKTTLVNLILRFFDVDSGRILIDGQDIKKVTQESLRDQISMIPQDPFLFHRSIAENIGYGDLNASLEEIIEASKQAHCHEFIEKIPGGYHSLVGEKGVKLSGGQRQRIAIARAILKNAPILILDEATSSLDSMTESYIQESLQTLMKGKTTIVIAHRLSTLFNMERILVFNKGKIIEDGTHLDLIQLNGHYTNLWNMQIGGFLKDFKDSYLPTQLNPQDLITIKNFAGQSIPLSNQL